MKEMSGPELRTARLRLRPWRDDDLEPFVAMNADPRVMEFFPAVYSRDESVGFFPLLQARFAARGFGIWAVEVVNGPGFIGMIGLGVPSFQAPFTPCVEVLWRLAFDHWGHGYASEGARAAVAFAFDRLALREIVAFTTVRNLRSRRVMEALGMTRAAEDDFMHPALAEGHPLRPHVLYRLLRTAPRVAPAT